jgi:lipopolysaccharide biosynthesis regulator YciM
LKCEIQNEILESNKIFKESCKQLSQQIHENEIMIEQTDYNNEINKMKNRHRAKIDYLEKEIEGARSAYEQLRESQNSVRNELKNRLRDERLSKVSKVVNSTQNSSVKEWGDLDSMIIESIRRLNDARAALVSPPRREEENRIIVKQQQKLSMMNTSVNQVFEAHFQSLTMPTTPHEKIVAGEPIELSQPHKKNSIRAVISSESKRIPFLITPRFT